ncbi:MAG TPA: hypothetical protein VGS03_18510 [Candidatus Polarisedimenticolia bacterium]|jgi:hypothetical protein|nr:hypothetical protein [Candidatus Polarisedimenticolia bacterium]
MTRRVLAVALVAAALALVRPERLEAQHDNRYDTDFPILSGEMREDSTCPVATHILISGCLTNRAPRAYLVFNRVKGIKRFANREVVVNGPVDSTKCGLPLMEVRKIDFSPNPPPPCPAP